VNPGILIQDAGVFVGPVADSQNSNGKFWESQNVDAVLKVKG
jgi:hypothetical protein